MKFHKTKFHLLTNLILINVFLFLINEIKSTSLSLLENDKNDYFNLTYAGNIGNAQINSNNIKSKPGTNCSYQNCPLGQGICYENTCICAYGFKTLVVPHEPLIFCNYIQKSKMTAFFLEFFFPIGAGHVYAGKYTLAIIKFTLFFLFFCGICGELCCLRMNFDKLIICNAFTILTVMCLWAILEFIDLFCYAFGVYNDGYGFPMV